MDDQPSVYTVVTLKRAELDINDAFIYIFERDPEAGMRWYFALKEDIQGLAKLPYRCSLAPESKKLGVELRQFVFGERTGRYRVIFHIVVEQKHEVHILAVRHGARQALEAEEVEI